MHVTKRGNSLCVELPEAVVVALALREGDEFEIRAAGEGGVSVARIPTREEVLVELRNFRGRLPPEFRFDRDEANAR